MDHSSPALGDSYWSTTAQLLAADAADSDEELVRALTSEGSSDAEPVTSAVSSPAGRLLTDADAQTSPPTTKRTLVQEQARRMRDRLKVRRLYYRKLDRLKELRAQVSSLEEQLETHQLSQQLLAPPDGACKKPETGTANVLQELANTRQQLQHENEYLRRAVERFVRCVHSVSVKLMELHEPPAAALSVRAMTHQECVDMQRRALDEMRAFELGRAQLQEVGATCGWESSQLVHDGVCKFHLEKRVPNASAERVAELTWGLLSTPVRFARLYSLAVEMKCHLLQVIDADNVVMLHEHRTMNPAETRDMVTRAVVLLSRVKTAAGYSITLTSLERDKFVLEDLSLREQLQDAVVWNEVFWWLQYTDAPTCGDEGDTTGEVTSCCACTFAGASSAIGESINFWMTEFVQLAVRWEVEVFGSASYVLPSDDGE